jgi:hypothetical protein
MARDGVLDRSLSVSVGCEPLCRSPVQVRHGRSCRRLELSRQSGLKEVVVPKLPALFVQRDDEEISPLDLREHVRRVRAFQDRV